MKNLILIFILFFSPALVIAQETASNTKDRITNAIYTEFLGLARFSFVYEQGVFERHRLGFGIGLAGLEMEDDRHGHGHESHGVFMPTIAYSYLFGKGPHFFEMGIGGGMGLFDISVFRINTFYESRYELYGFIGWRKQSSDMFVYRAGFAPLIMPANEHYTTNFWPLFNLSMGYAF